MGVPRASESAEMVEQINRNQALVQSIQHALDNNDLLPVRGLLNQLHPSEIADLLESMPTQTRDELWVHISSDVEGHVLSHSNTAVRTALLEQMEPAECCGGDQRARIRRRRRYPAGSTGTGRRPGLEFDGHAEP